jgi:hypothetical protein
MMTVHQRNSTGTWAGWHVFAAFLLFVVGCINALEGLVAIFADDVFLGRTDRFTIVLDVTGWGWVHLVWGLFLIVAGVSLFLAKPWARFVAIVLVAVNIVTQAVAIPFNPVYALLVIAMDVAIVWALIVHAEALDNG